MEKEEKCNQRMLKPPAETEFFLQWGNRKRLRCVRVRGTNLATQASSDHPSSSRISHKISSKFLKLSNKSAVFPQSTSRFTRNCETAALRWENWKSSSVSPEKEDRFYSTRGSTVGGFEENGKVRVEEGAGNQGGDQNSSKRLVCPKLFISLSSKEKEDDFMAMKGCKLPQRPKKRAKVIQRTLLVSLLLLLLFPTHGGRPLFLSFLI
ncbi:Hypothetical predicted protein [Olea europaea subsp. europaea]|uniref:Uncharacterized protein n=1 Tax=Olea europaea subsp. europaea TaxID=158383 RepID=A0A8S0PKH8_OLEEU|nr:Hypothetical predicted protein [Olea europaea subsp. europaea]